MVSISPNQPQIKLCKLCQQEKGIASFDGTGICISPICIECAKNLPPVPEGKKRCNQCFKDFDVSAFREVSGNGRRFPWCKQCYSDYRKARHDPKAARNAHLQRTYNLSLEEYEVMFFQQGGLCAICKQPETQTLRGKPKPLDVDHNHQTDQVRQLLCSRCNCLVRDVERNRELVKQALAYLKKHDT